MELPTYRRELAEQLEKWNRMERSEEADPPPTVLSEMGGFALADSTPTPAVGSECLPRQLVRTESRRAGLIDWLLFPVAVAVVIAVGWLMGRER